MMRILVEFTDASNGDVTEFEMEGPDMDTGDLRELVLAMVQEASGKDFPEDFDLKITEIAHGTIH